MSRSLSRRVLRARRRERWSAWVPPVLAVALVAVLICLAAANVVVWANWNELVDGVLWVDRAVRRHRGRGCAGRGRGPGRDRGRGRAAGARRRPGAVHRRRGGASPFPAIRRPHRLYVAAARSVPPDRRHPGAGGGGRNPVVLRAGRRRRVHAAGRRRGSTPETGNPGNAAFFSGSAWRSSACSPSRSAGGWIGWTWVFYWADAIATLVLAPLFVHFALVFPERAPGAIRNRLGHLVVPMVYAPAVALGLLQAVTLAGDAGSAVFTTAVERVWNLEIAYLAGCVVCGLALMILTLRRVPSVTSKTPTAMDRVGGDSGRAALRRGLRDPVGARVRPGAARRHRDSVGPDSVGVRVGHRPVPACVTSR